MESTDEGDVLFEGMYEADQRHGPGVLLTRKYSHLFVQHSIYGDTLTDPLAKCRVAL